jgi:hypothetical protein
MYNTVYIDLGSLFFADWRPLIDSPQVQDVEYVDVDIENKTSDNIVATQHLAKEDYESLTL